MQKEPKVGDILHIVFFDHADMEEGDTTPLLFEVFGRLMDQTSVHYKIAKWITPGATEDPNAEYYSIIKGAVESVKVLK